ncbi:MAG: hypothetical protein M1831_002255 [Alyxoria varia]|nr:MAG: hypothetical protein M1831_002255 [Alyxoria varia]
MANSSQILEDLLNSPPTSALPITYQWLLPNRKGLENFLSTFSSSSPSQDSAATCTDNGPALNTSTQDPNDMPNSITASEAMSKPRSASANRTSQTPTDSGPALNTSSQNPNDMPSSLSGVDAMTKPRSSPSPTTNPTHEISIFTAATESFTHANTNTTISQSLSSFHPLITHAKNHNISTRAYISVALGCPYEGPSVSPTRVASIATSLLDMGVSQISVADTTGMGTPPKTATLLKTLQKAGVRPENLALHFHDTYGTALVNTMVGLEHGVRVFDASVAGLGGCPFSPGASGNVATEDLAHLCEGLGVGTGVDVEEIARIGEWISGEVGRGNESRAGRATLAKARL